MFHRPNLAQNQRTDQITTELTDEDLALAAGGAEDFVFTQYYPVLRSTVPSGGGIDDREPLGSTW